MSSSVISETLEVNLDHFMQPAGEIVECFERSKYDQFLTFLNEQVFSSRETTDLFVRKKGLTAIYETLFTYSSDDEMTSPLLSMKRCMIIALGMYFREEHLFNAPTCSIIVNNTGQQEIETNLFKNYFNQILLSDNEKGCLYRNMDYEGIGILKIAVFNSLCTFVDVHASGMDWFTNEMECFSRIFPTCLRSDNIYLRQACAQCLLLVVQYWYKLGNKEILQKFINILEPFKKEDMLDFLDFVLQLITLSFNDHNNTFDFAMLRPLSTEILQNALAESQLIERLVHDETIANVHDLRVVERLYDILIYLSNHNLLSGNKQVNSLKLLTGKTDDVVSHTCETVEACLLSGDIGYQNIGLKILSNFSSELLPEQSALSLLSILVTMWKRMFEENNDTQYFNNLKCLSVKQKGKFILAISKCLQRFMQIPSTIDYCDKNDLHGLLVFTVKMYEHINNSLCSKVLEVLLCWALKAKITLKNEHSDYLWQLLQNSLIPDIVSLVGKIIPLTCKNEESRFYEIVTTRFYDMNWELRDAAIDIIRTSLNDNTHYATMTQFVAQKDILSHLIGILSKKLQDTEHYVVLTTFKTLHDLIVLEHRRSLQYDFGMSLLAEILRTASSNHEYFIKKEAIEICKNLIAHNVIPFSQVLQDRTLLQNLNSFIHSSTMDCDVEVSQQFLLFIFEICNLEHVSTFEKFKLFIELGIESLLGEYFENIMEDATFHLTQQIVKKLHVLKLEDRDHCSSYSSSALCTVIDSYFQSLQHEEHHHEGKQEIPNFFNFNNEDYDCQCC
ncbi:hypothetical protein C9374_009671 [Naegleria lovaniensis]|uniref:Uncharacterized protein n=1 Tax=Naegleria lovaniensis TaxID=51637 RepID=A0AA88H3P7_NAELO|nr:uncharacterized protein C9374_009671 [Naegleria lovaniensis]KAG2393094.1 hypothetical protein C9374_009671 [Naegleria lovaniensis]